MFDKPLFLSDVCLMDYMCLVNCYVLFHVVTSPTPYYIFLFDLFSYDICLQLTVIILTVFLHLSLVGKIDEIFLVKLFTRQFVQFINSCLVEFNYFIQAYGNVHQINK